MWLLRRRGTLDIRKYSSLPRRFTRDCFTLKIEGLKLAKKPGRLTEVLTYNALDNCSLDRVPAHATGLSLGAVVAGVDRCHPFHFLPIHPQRCRVGIRRGHLGNACHPRCDFVCVAGARLPSTQCADREVVAAAALQYRTGCCLGWDGCTPALERPIFQLLLHLGLVDTRGAIGRDPKSQVFNDRVVPYEGEVNSGSPQQPEEPRDLDYPRKYVNEWELLSIQRDGRIAFVVVGVYRG